MLWGGGHHREECGVNTWPKKLTMALISRYLSADWSADVLGTIKRGELYSDTNLSMFSDRANHGSQIYVRNWHKLSALQLLQLGRWLATALFSLSSTFLMEEVLVSKNLWLDPFPDPVGHFVPLAAISDLAPLVAVRHCRQCYIVGGE